MRDLPRLLSRPVDVHWAGWKSDTLTLQQNGWQIAAEQDFARMGLRIALKHQDHRMYGVSKVTDWDYYRNAQGFPPAIGSDGPFPPHLVMQQMASHMQYRVEAGFNPLTSFRPIDAYPQMVHHEIRDIEDLMHFAPVHARTRQLIVPNDSVSDLMERILKLQQPGREEFFLREAKEERWGDPRGEIITGRPKQKFHAQIISLAEAA